MALTPWGAQDDFLSGSPVSGLSPGALAVQNQNTSGRYLGRVNNMANNVSGLGDVMSGYGRGLMSRWDSRINPLWDRMSSIANQTPDWMIGRAAIDSNQSFDESQGVMNRTLSRMGINPNSGRFAGLNQKWALARAAAEAGAKTRAAQQSQETMYSRLAQLLGIGNQGLNQGANMLSGAAGAYGNAGNDFMGLAGQFDRLAGEAGMWDQQTRTPTTARGLQAMTTPQRKQVQYSAEDPRYTAPTTPSAIGAPLAQPTGLLGGRDYIDTESSWVSPDYNNERMAIL